MHFHARFRETHTLSDGTRVTLRPIRPGDADELHRAYHRLSPESRYRRFLTASADLSDEMLRYLTEVDGDTHFAVVALHESLDLKEESIVGVGRFVRLAEDPEVAESAVTVIDGMQNRGLGKLLSMTLRDAALERGVKKFRVEVLLSNAPVRHLLAEVGAEEREDNGETLVFDVDLAHTLQDRASVPRFLAAAATTMKVLLRRLAPGPGAASSAPPPSQHDDEEIERPSEVIPPAPSTPSAGF